MTPAAAPRSHRVAPIPSSPASVRRVEAHPASPLGCLDAAPSLLLRDDVAMLFQSFEAAGDGSTGYWLAMPALLWRRTSALLRFDPKRSCPEGMASVFKLLSVMAAIGRVATYNSPAAICHAACLGRFARLVRRRSKEAPLAHRHRD